MVLALRVCEEGAKSVEGVLRGRVANKKGPDWLAFAFQPGPWTVKNWYSRVGQRSPYRGDEQLRFTVQHDRTRGVLAPAAGVAGANWVEHVRWRL